MKAHRLEFRIRSMCRVLKVHPSGFYRFLKKPHCHREIQNQQFMTMIQQFWIDSEQSYGSPRVAKDFWENGIAIGENRVAKLMRRMKLSPVRTYQRPKYRKGKPSIVFPNRLQQEFQVPELNTSWATDITYIRTQEGWLFLSVVLDLCSRMVVGWAMQSNQQATVVTEALRMAIGRRSPPAGLVIHSDQGSQYTSDAWHRICKHQGIVPSMSRRGNCYDNAVVESFFSNLKKEKIRRKIYKTRDEARSELFAYIEVFYNRKRRHSHLGLVSPLAFEQQLLIG